MWPLLNSSFLSTLTTFIVGSFAIFIYFRQKSDEKRSAAITLINEIRNVETTIQSIKDAIRESSTIPEVTVLPFNSWNKYSSFFARDFDQDEIRLVNKFYSDAERVGYIVTQANNMFLVQVHNRSRALQQVNINIINEAKNEEEAKGNLKLFESKLWAPGISSSPYLPSGFYDKLTKYLPEMQPVLSTSVGIKLKRIAKVE